MVEVTDDLVPVRIVSYGRRYGVPLDTTLSLDVRHLRNRTPRHPSCGATTA